jgi:RNA polymerase sigma-70 factor (ECF subfamily)
MRADPEARLVEACQRGTPTGLTGPYRELYDLYKDRVYNVCFRITGNAPDALDASQETFGIVFRKLSAFRFESRFSSWVYRIAVNASIDLKRRSQSRRNVSLDAIRERRAANGGQRYDPIDDKVEMPMLAASRRELEGEVQRAIGKLSSKLQAITVLRYNESLSYEEISETLQISLGTVKSRLARAHQVLDRELTPVLDRFFLG